MTYQPPVPPANVRPAKGPWWRSLWFVALVAAFIGVGIGAAGGSSKAKTTTVAGPTTYATTIETATATATITATPTIVKVIATRTRTVRVTYTPPPPKQYGEGTYVVGTDIQPGDYRTAGSSDCYWARLSSLNTSDIIDNSTSSGPQTIHVASSDKALEIQGACTFGRV